MTTGLPKNVRAQEEQADELYRQRYTPDDTRNPEDDPQGDPNDPAAQPRDPESSDEPRGDDPAPEDKGEDYYKQRFHVLQGKYNAETRRLADSNRDLKERNERNEQRLTELEQSLQEQRRNAPVNLSEHFSEEELEEFGQDTLQLVLRTADRLSDSKVEKVRSEFGNDLEQVRQTQAKSQEERFWDTLANAVPDYEAINDDARFHQWLAETVPVYTDQGTQQQSRQTLLEGYQRQGNARAVADLFKQFKGKASKGEHDDPRRQREVPPRTNGSAAQQTTPKGEVWVTNAEIDAHYNSDENRRWQRNDPEGWRAREQEIERAVAAGRVK